MRSLLGVDDEGVVVTEPFRQWVITDDFVSDRPAWELAGAVLTRDVAPWETAKLRLLNASHSLLAYLGALSGYDTIAEAVRDDDLEAAVRRLMYDDVVPSLVAPDGLDLPDYCEQLLTRFANPSLRHRTVQVAMDGSQKLPARVLGTIRDRFAAGATPQGATLVVASWMAYVARAASDSSGLPLDDPLAGRLAKAATSAGATRRAWWPGCWRSTRCSATSCPSRTPSGRCSSSRSARSSVLQPGEEPLAVDDYTGDLPVGDDGGGAVGVLLRDDVEAQQSPVDVHQVRVHPHRCADGAGPRVRDLDPAPDSGLTRVQLSVQGGHRRLLAPGEESRRAQDVEVSAAERSRRVVGLDSADDARGGTRVDHGR